MFQIHALDLHDLQVAGLEELDFTAVMSQCFLSVHAKVGCSVLITFLVNVCTTSSVVPNTDIISALLQR